MLPVDLALPEILAALDAHGAVVVESPPGSGKTTRIPPALADRFPGQIWVLEPRRVAARAAAVRVAAERGEPVGKSVGYAMRFERVGGDAKILFVTEALLGRRFATDPHLTGIGAVILDEFHERSIHTDLALARVHALRRERPDLKLVVMSATIEGDRVATWLGCPRVVAEGRMFPVDIEYLNRRDERPVEVLAAAAVRDALRRDDGDVLVFLPGRGEMDRCAGLIGPVDADVLSLHGDLDGGAQDRALRIGPRRRVVLATNVAETSVTVEGVRTVIDTGLARISGFDPWSGIETLTVSPISRASSAQRAGRAGRTASGRCLRLYTREDHDTRPAETEPDIRRMDLARVFLDVGDAPPPWFEPPPPAAWRAARDLLSRLGAWEEGVTAIGVAMRRLPVAPRIGRLLVEAVALGVPIEGASLAAILGDRRTGVADDPVSLALDGRWNAGVERERRQLVDLVRGVPGRGPGVADALARSLLAAFPDRVGRRTGTRVVFSEGGRGELDAGTPGADGIVVVTGVERVGNRVRVRSMTPIPADWLLDAAVVCEEFRWTGTRVEGVETLAYGEIAIEESVRRGTGAAAEQLLFDNVLPIAHRSFPDFEAAQALLARVGWLRCAGEEFPVLLMDSLVRDGCTGCASLADLKEVSLVSVAFSGALAGRRGEVDRLAPEAVALGNRNRVPIVYAADQAPFLASRMQDFFGLADGPRLGHRPLVLHLLSPSGRPVQVTTDLAGFWERHYPAIRRELMRRYPRHFWPENPREAEPPVPRGPRVGR